MDRKFLGQIQMPSESHTKAAEHHESAAKSHRAAADHHGKNDHTKGRKHATEAQKHSKVARAASDDAHAKSSSKKKQLGGQVAPGLPSRRSITRLTSVVQQKSGSDCDCATRSISCRNA